MFLVMNRFKITAGFEPGFEESWRERDSVLSQAPGFKRFALLKGPVTDAYVLYASHSVWSLSLHLNIGRLQTVSAKHIVKLSHQKEHILLIR